MEFLFSYGTLQSPMVQEKLFYRKVKMRTVTLDNHALFTCRDGFFTIAGKKGSSIRGAILEISKEELLVADLWEMAPDLYQRSDIELVIDGLSIKAWIYKRFEDGQVAVDQSNITTCSLADEALADELNEFLQEYSQQINKIYSGTK